MQGFKEDCFDKVLLCLECDGIDSSRPLRSFMEAIETRWLILMTWYDLMIFKIWPKQVDVKLLSMRLKDPQCHCVTFGQKLEQGKHIEIRVSSHLSCHRTTCFAVASYWRPRFNFSRDELAKLRMHFRIFRIFSTLEKCRPCLSFVTLTSWFASEMTRWQDWVAKSSTLSHDVPHLMHHGDKTRELGELLQEMFLGQKHLRFDTGSSVRFSGQELIGENSFLSHFVSWNCKDLWVSARKFSPDLSDTWFLGRQDVSIEQDMNSWGFSQTSSWRFDLQEHKRKGG